MAQKKYLDQEGVQYLWSKVSLQDYPNNDTLIAVLNAIDDTKADKESLSNVALTGNWEDIQNKTTEEWIFTLEDGSTVTKKVVIEQ